MMLFRYLRSHWIKTLEECRFKMASVTDFNDPFDGCGRCEGCLNGQGAEAFLREGNPLTSALMGKTMAVKGYELSLRQAVQNRDLVSEVKALCFSACEDGDPSQKLMWAHYANGYRGVRIGLQLDDPNFPLYLDSVKYCQERPTLNLSKIKSVQKDEEVLRFWISNLTTKSNEWAYEREWRIIADEQHLISGIDDMGNLAWFWSFDSRILRSVDVGCLMSQDEINEIVAVVRARCPAAKVRRVVLDELSYGIRYETVYEAR